MTSITYNSVQIKNVLTEMVEHDIVMDDTGADPLYVRVTVNATGIVHASPAVSNTIGYQSSVDPTLSWQTILAQLMQPRRSFLMEVSGRNLFNIQPGARRGSFVNGLGGNSPDSGVDVGNGPKTKVTLLQITGGYSFRVRFQCTFHVVLCDETGYASPSNVINFRYWIGEDIDCRSWNTTRTYSGRLRVAHKGINVHEALRRHQCIPAVQPGFRRKSLNFSESPDGLSIEFRIQDEELWAQAPHPATWMDGSYTVSSSEPGGALATAELRVSLEGPKQTNKKSLHSLAAKILNSKLHLYDGQNEGRNFLLAASISESLSANRVDAFARIRLLGTSSEDYNLYNIVGDDLGTPLSLTQADGLAYDKETAYTLSLGGLSATFVGLFRSDLQDPCHVAEMPFVVGSSPEGAPEAEATGDYPQQDAEDTPTTKEIDYNSDHFASAYSTYQLTSDIKQAKGKIAMPIGETSSSADNTVKVVTLHSGCCHREVKIVAERLNKWPNIPDDSDFTDSNGIGHTCISYMPAPSAPVLSADGIKTLHRTDAVIMYALDRPPSSAEPLPVGNLPYRSSGTQSQYSTLPGQFRITPGSSDQNSPLPT